MPRGPMFRHIGDITVSMMAQLSMWLNDGQALLSLHHRRALVNTNILFYA
jgi:hypothetical protein